MSFILDALRKSEHERERKALPGVADVPVARPSERRMPLALLALGVLLAVNLVVLFVVLLRGDRAPDAGDAATAPAPTAAGTSGAPRPLGAGAGAPNGESDASGSAPAGWAGTPAAPLPAVAARDVRPLQDEAGAGIDAAAIDGEAPPYAEPPPVPRDPTLVGERVPRVTAVPRDETVQGVPRELVEESQRAALAAAATRAGGAMPGDAGTGAGAAAGNVPSIANLPPQATAGLPPMALTLHVYANDPSQRFVFLNGRRYQEGAQLAEGPTLERIVPEGAILNHRGQRMLVPRQ